MEVLCGGLEVNGLTVKSEPHGLRIPGIDSTEATEFLSALGQYLMTPSITTQFPELAPLGFFLRRRKLDSLGSRLVGNESKSIRVPRGLIFHVPPANVDTVFVYSWALSLMCGNANIVRISKRFGPTSQYLIDAISQFLSKTSAEFQRSQAFVAYEHEEHWTETFSLHCDLRVLWGGDQTIDSIRRFRLSPRGRDLVFPDRKSLSLISAETWNELSSTEKRDLATKFAQDAYWFNQAACSSPQMIVWVGTNKAVETASVEFEKFISESRLVMDISQNTGFLIDRVTSSVVSSMRGLVSKYTENFPGFRLNFPIGESRINEFHGTGAFEFRQISNLSDLALVIQRRDQTCTYFGFGREELIRLARTLNGQGIDRFVPIGSALDFAEEWDGEDFLVEFSRLVSIR
jgi:hypothetical protein